MSNLVLLSCLVCLPPVLFNLTILVSSAARVTAAAAAAAASDEQRITSRLRFEERGVS
jgi:hypothetical protein